MQARGRGGRGVRQGAPKFISAWVGGGQGATERVRRNSLWVGGGHGATEINFGQHAGAGRGRTRGERKGAPKFISAWVGGGQGATEINFGQRAGAGQGRTRGAAGCAEIHFGMGWGRTRGDRNKFRSTGRRGAGADAGRGRVRRNSFRHGLGEDKGRPRGCAEIHFGMGCEQKRGDRNKFRSTGRRGAGADAGRGRVRRNLFRHGLGEDMGRPK
jgi:hypothetical protein